MMADGRRLLLAAVVFVVMGLIMNSAGRALDIAWFKHWWQIGPCYLGYVLPLAYALRGRSADRQWQLSVLAFIPLELMGYALGSSVIADDNIIARLWGPHNFTLVMVLLVAPTPIVGNAIVDAISRILRWPPSSTP